MSMLGEVALVTGASSGLGERFAQVLASQGAAVVLAALTGALALPLGLALAWALLAFVNVEAFGWRLPMYLFPLDYLRLAGFALTAAAVAAAWPAWRLWRMPPVALLGVFRNER